MSQNDKIPENRGICLLFACFSHGFQVFRRGADGDLASPRKHEHSAGFGTDQLQGKLVHLFRSEVLDFNRIDVSCTGYPGAKGVEAFLH